MRTVALILCLAGCGRIAFDPATAPGDAQLTGDGQFAPGDAPPGSLLVTFGETGDATFAGVTADTSISATGPANDNYGATDYMLVQAFGGAVSLIRFDLTALPASTTIVTATLRMWMVGGDPGDAIAYAMREAWDEGTADGMPGDASYNERVPGVAWSGVGATPPSRDSASAGTGTLGAIGAPCDVVLDTALVQQWVSTPAMNFGLALLGTSVNTDVATREAPTASQRPLLTVVYLP